MLLRLVAVKWESSSFRARRMPIVSYQDRCFLNFLRLAENEREAVLSALEDIQQAGFHVLEEDAPEQVIVSYLPCPAY